MQSMILMKNSKRDFLRQSINTKHTRKCLISLTKVLFGHRQFKKLTHFFLIEYLLDLNLRYVRIYFDTTSFMRITKYKSTTFEDKLSAIGGTMGLLTGCSIISWVEIIYFGIKIIVNWIIKF